MCRVQRERVSGRSPGPTRAYPWDCGKFQRPRADPSRGHISGHGAETVAKGRGGGKRTFEAPKAEGVIDRPSDPPLRGYVQRITSALVGATWVRRVQTARAYEWRTSTPTGFDPIKSDGLRRAAHKKRERAERMLVLVLILVLLATRKNALCVFPAFPRSLALSALQ